MRNFINNRTASIFKEKEDKSSDLENRKGKHGENELLVENIKISRKREKLQLE